MLGVHVYSRVFACTFVGGCTVVCTFVSLNVCLSSLVYCACFSVLVYKICAGTCAFMCDSVHAYMIKDSGACSGQSLDLGLDANRRGLTLRGRSQGRWGHGGRRGLPPAPTLAEGPPSNVVLRRGGVARQQACGQGLGVDYRQEASSKTGSFPGPEGGRTAPTGLRVGSGHTRHPPTGGRPRRHSCGIQPW